MNATIEAVTRSLHRRSTNHVLLTGERGVGKSSVVAELARQAAEGEIPFLASHRFLHVDARFVAPPESGQRLAGILAHAEAHPNLVVCIDGLANLCRSRWQSEMDHRMFLLSALSRASFRLIGLVTPHEYEEITSDLPEMSEFFQRIDVEEPQARIALDQMHHYAAGLAEEFERRKRCQERMALRVATPGVTSWHGDEGETRWRGHLFGDQAERSPSNP